MELQTVSENAVFNSDYNEGLIHQVVTAYMAAGRAGTKAQKTRSEVRGGGRKPWKQKGTGNARAGTIRSPLWRSGGITFAAKPRDYSKKVNKKMYRGAIRSIISELIRQDRLCVVEALELAEAKTKLMADRLTGLGLADTKLLIIDEPLHETIYLAARNLKNVATLDVQGVDPVSLIAFDKILISKAALTQLEEMFK